jgi:prepilin-type processing-associated H-X9-DG protein
VKADEVRHSATTILATEMWGIQRAMEASSNIPTNTSPVSNTRRPVSGISASRSTPPLSGPDKAYLLPLGGTFGWAKVDNMTPDPAYAFTTGGGIPNPDTTLDFVGRNHGERTLGNVAGSARGPVWDLRKSNFLYVDGHVETKHVSETVYPLSQWGDKFYSLPPY